MLMVFGDGMFKPNCLNKKKEFGHSAGGWILPCCWLDPNEMPITDDRINALFSEDLKIENVDIIEDILLSEPWINFSKVIKSGNNVPKICKLKCSS